MSEKKQKAVSAFNSGFNCAQSVLNAFADDLNIDKELISSLTSGFGGGMGKLQETCGAVTGSFMVLGLTNGIRFSENTDRKEATNNMVKLFHDQFVSQHGTISCKQLLGADLNTASGRQYLLDNKVFKYVCEKCIADAVEITERLLAENI